MLLAAGFFGYMLALLQRRVGTMVSPEEVSIKFLALMIKVTLLSKHCNVDLDYQGYRDPSFASRPAYFDVAWLQSLN